MLKWRSAYGVFCHIEEIFITLLLAGMVGVTFIQVVLRYVFNSGFFWALEVTSTLFAWLVLFGSSWVVKQGSHIGVDALVNLFGVKTQKILGLLSIVACSVYAGIIFYGGWVYISKMKRAGIMMEDIHLEIWIAYLVVPFGLGLIFLRLLGVAYRVITDQQVNMLTRDEAKDAIEQFSKEIEQKPSA
ncbi:MAG: TRAP transporter small permease [Alphaproteobacteria bacterium]